jgi:hypothetical protein
VDGVMGACCVVAGMAGEINKVAAEDGGVVEMIARPVVIALDLGLYALAIAGQSRRALDNLNSYDDDHTASSLRSVTYHGQNGSDSRD